MRQEPDPVPTTTVLIVEDDDAIREALTLMLKELTGCQVIAVSDGFEALRTVRTLTPQVIVLDYQLPNMDGLECLESLRACKGVEQTPVILMSAALPKRARERSDLTVLQKPFEMDALFHLIIRLLGDEDKAPL